MALVNDARDSYVALMRIPYRQTPRANFLRRKFLNDCYVQILKWNDKAQGWMLLIFDRATRIYYRLLLRVVAVGNIECDVCAVSTTVRSCVPPNHWGERFRHCANVAFNIP